MPFLIFFIFNNILLEYLINFSNIINCFPFCPPYKFFSFQFFTYIYSFFSFNFFTVSILYTYTSSLFETFFTFIILLTDTNDSFKCLNFHCFYIFKTYLNLRVTLYIHENYFDIYEITFVL